MPYILLFPRVYAALWLISLTLYAAYHILALDAYFKIDLRWMVTSWPDWVKRVAWASVVLVVVIASYSVS